MWWWALLYPVAMLATLVVVDMFRDWLESEIPPWWCFWEEQP